MEINGKAPNFAQRISRGRPSGRFWFGLVLALIFIIIGFALAAVLIPSWGATPAEVSRLLPGDERVPDPQILWNHAITIRAEPGAIYPWLAQIGDTRGGFYSYTFIENLIVRLSGLSGRYTNAGRIHPEWQNPPAGQGIIMNNIAIQETQPGQYVLAGATPDFQGVRWSWLWYLDPVDAHTTRLIVRHRIQFPPEVPGFLVKAVFDAGYVMERSMLRGIRDRAEGRLPPAPLEGLDAAIWLAVLAIGVASAVQFVRHPGRWHPLGVGLEAVVVLFLLTFAQPPIWLSLILLLGLAFSLWIGYKPGMVSAWIRERV